MARVKSDKPVLLPVPDWKHADEMIARIGDFQMQIIQAEHKASDDIKEVKADLAENVKDLQGKVKLYVQSLDAFCTTHQADFGKQRSRKLNFGILGWRKSTSVKTKKTTLELIKKVFSRARAAACIRVKESVDKEVLARLTDEQLASVAARREVKDVFFVEPDKMQAVDYCE